MCFYNISDQNNDVIAQRVGISKSLSLQTNKLTLNGPAGEDVFVKVPQLNIQFCTVVKNNMVYLFTSLSVL